MVFLKKGSLIIVSFCLLILFSYLAVAGSFSVGQVQVKPPAPDSSNPETSVSSGGSGSNQGSSSGASIGGSKSSGTGFVFFIPGVPKTSQDNQVNNNSIKPDDYNSSINNSSNSSNEKINEKIIDAEQEHPASVSNNQECPTAPSCSNTEAIRERIQRILIIVITILLAVLIYFIIFKRKKKR